MSLVHRTHNRLDRRGWVIVAHFRLERHAPLTPPLVSSNQPAGSDIDGELRRAFEAEAAEPPFVPGPQATGAQRMSMKQRAWQERFISNIEREEQAQGAEPGERSVNDTHGLTLAEVARTGVRLFAQIGRHNAGKRYRWDDAIDRALDHATADGQRGRKHPGVKSWFAFCEGEMGTSAERPLDPLAPLVQKLEEEMLAMRYVCALVEEKGLTPDSARVYFSAVQGWHSKEFGIKIAGGLKLERLPAMLKGLRRLHGGSTRPVRKGFAPQLLRRAMDRVLDPSNPLHANVRAALSTAVQGLLRSAEFCGDQGKDTLRRADLIELSEQDMRIMIHQCKNTSRLTGKSHELLIGAGGGYIDAVAEVKNLIKVDPTGAQSPLFRDPQTNKPLSYEFMLDMTRQLATAVGEDPSLYGTHSYRIAGATALFNAGASDTVVRMMGRWSSDIYRVYLRACKEHCRKWSRTAGSTVCQQFGFQFDEVDWY